MEFEWDNNKHQSNIKKHGVDFEEARSVFDDNFAIIIEDRFHSNQEQREVNDHRHSRGLEETP